ncbi:MAG: DUF1294 domain-containing protein [Bacteroidaceae bacterium]|nr:DUF1294 domain-containing protein [Bacteroidaceae bacterium]
MKIIWLDTTGFVGEGGRIALIYLVVINVVAFFLYGIDKLKAKHSKWRISEAALLGVAVLGGSVGAWLGMKVWHHKTLHKKFKYGVPLILIAQVALILLTSYKARQTMQYFRNVKGVVSVEYDHVCRLTDPVKIPIRNRIAKPL